MRLAGAGLVFASLIAAQTPAAPGLVRGTLLECEGGELSVRTATNEVFRFRFDDHTYCERERERVKPSSLKAGEILEVVADVLPATVLRYARTVHVVEPPRPVRPPTRLSPWRNPIENLAPTGNLTFAGIVSRVNRGQIVLHTRDAGDKTILLRQDTRYLNSGVVVEGAILQPNTRVFVRAGKDLYGEIEAYQVIWGEILQPRP